VQESWAISGIDLHVDVASTGRVRSLESGLRDAIREGRLTAGTRLPATRTLAQDIGIARNSVADVYAQLVAEGWLTSRVGAGTWVTSRPAVAVATEPTVAAQVPELDLRGGIPDASSFPHAEWATAYRRALNSASGGVFGYPPRQGVRPLREALAGYLARTRGTLTSPELVLVARGFGDLLALTGRALVAGGARSIAVEEYGHEAHRAILAACGLQVVPVRVDEHGIVVSDLDALGVDAVLLTAAHQFPTGVPLSPQRRVEVVRWAEAGDRLIVEDDYDGEFRYDRRSIGALQALAPECVLYAGTASKSLAPAVGLAWGVPPSWLLPLLIEQGLLLGGGADALTQLALAEFMGSHHYDRHVRRLRASYRSRREALNEAIELHVPGARVTGLSAGLHCLVELPSGVSEDRVSAEAATRGLRVEGLATYLPAGRPGSRPPAMVIGYGASRQPRFHDAVAAAIEAIRAASGSP